VLCLLAGLATGVVPLGGQAIAAAPANGESERYLRALQLLGKVPVRPWSIRGLGPTELDTLLREAGVPSRREDTVVVGGTNVRWRWLPANAIASVNTGFPFGFNDGPVWAGRGLTVQGSAGIGFRIGDLSLSIAPIAFIAQNAAFRFTPADTGRFRFVNLAAPAIIDFPERFGDGSYGRIDPGESELRLDVHGLAAGLSTAAQSFGPAAEHPIILGNNAGGFPHAFIGTSRPAQIGFFILHGRIEWGELVGSAYAPDSSVGRRFASAAIVTLSFSGARGLELGATRFFHTPWPDRGLADAPFLKVFEGLLKENLATPDNPIGDAPEDNQLASVFFRWASPKGIEVYGEYGREDHNWNSRDFWLEIDHDAAYLIGLQRAWRSGQSTSTVFRAEHLNTRLSHLALAARQTPWYVHGVVREGHTLRGQPLGSIGGFGGGATTVALDRYTPRGRLTFRWDRIMRAEAQTDGIANPWRADVLHALGVEMVRPGHGGWWTLGATTVWELNRDFAADAFNLNLTAGFSPGSRR
jgi:hypothetical protein